MGADPKYLDELAVERRKRLVAEKLLVQRTDELYNANKQLSAHADTLTVSVTEREAEKHQALAERDRASSKADRAERLLWDALAAIPEGFAVFNASSVLVAANAAFLSTFDDLEDITLGVTYEEILHLSVDEGLVNLGEIAADDWVKGMLERWHSGDFQPFNMQLYNGVFYEISETRTEAGDTVCMAKDITSSMNRQAELLEARDRAQAASRAKSAFLAKMSHEIRTPMNGVVGMSELLLESTLNEEQSHFAQTIRSSGEALLDIINNILDFSKLEAERVEFRAVPFDLEAVLVDVGRLTSATLSNMPVEVVLDYPMDAPRMFIGDPGRIRQIVTNLAGNAAKFTEDGTIMLEVKVRASGGEACVTLAVEDTGLGIPNNKLEHVFGDFNQAEDSEDRKHEGTGLGLAITRKLIEQMGGKITLTSTVGEGSRFEVALRLKLDAETWTIDAERLTGIPIWYSPTNTLSFEVLVRQLTAIGLDMRNLQENAKGGICMRGVDETHIPEAALPGPCLLVGAYSDVKDDNYAADAGRLMLPCTARDLVNALDKLIPASHGSSTCLRVLAAEDNKTNQLVLRAMLKDHDLNIKMVENGQELVRTYQKDHSAYDVILSDISMPLLDGMQAAIRIRAFEANQGLSPIPMVAMTAHALQGDQERVLDSGFDVFLTKPLKKKVLLAALQDIAARPTL